ncbi:hypothetical protein [Sphingomonas carotinifaciens]|uniref:hypothetical protein n=1 Tax=Sphingomonas carotinifaciens TaxID=1166323 RepID=UPI001968A0FA|nr:hypothetical protein [Sphingomonas carotinifaciens]
MTCVTDEAARANLARLASAGGHSFASLSTRIGRNVAYLQQFVKRGTPRRLPEDERRALAMILQVDERLLGARDPWAPEAGAASPGGASCSRSEA